MLNFGLKSIVIDFLISFFISIMLLFAMAFVFWPGVLTDDSIFQLMQAVGLLPINDDHMITMSVLLRFFTDTDLGVFNYLFFQVIVIAISVGLSLSFIRNVFFSYFNIKKRVFFLLTLSTFLCLAPPYGILNMIIWKDVIFNWLIFLELSISLCVVYLYYKKKYIGKIDFLLVVLCSTSAAFSMHFRHNAYTLAVPLLFVVFFFSYLKYRLLKKNKLFICLGVLAFVLLIGTRFVLISDYISRDKINYRFNRTWITSWIYQNDYMLALKYGLKLDKEEEYKTRAILNIDIDKFRGQINGDNTFFNGVLLYNNGIVDKKIEQFTRVSKEVLFNHLCFWIYTKLIYTKNFVISENGYQLPASVQNGCYHVVLSEELMNDTRLRFVSSIPLNCKYDRYRIKIFEFYKYGNYFFKLVFWTFIPVFFIQTLTFLLVIVSAMYRNNKLLNFIRKHSVLIILPFFSSIFLVGPLIILSITNDYRYFWPIYGFTILLLIILLSLYNDYIKGE